MHILHLYKDYYPVVGGIENHIRARAEAQAARGHTVTVLVTDPGPRTTETVLNGVRVIKAGRLGTVASTPLSPALFEVLGGLRPDITHVQAPYPIGELAQGWRGRRPYVVSHQADVTRGLQRLIMLAYGPWYRRFLRGAARVLATTPNFARSSPYLRGLGERLVIAPIGCDLARFRPAPRAPGLPFTALYVGQLRHYKGLETLVAALAQTPGARLVLAGDGPLRARLEAQALRLGVAGRVRFLGRVADEALPQLYQAADVLVLPSTSRAESFGTVLVEAMACGRPCITTEIGTGTSYVVQAEVTGLVVAPRRPDALAGALARLQADPGLAARLGAAGRARAEQEFSAAAMAARVEALYQQVVAQTREAG